MPRFKTVLLTAIIIICSITGIYAQKDILSKAQKDYIENENSNPPKDTPPEKNQ